MKNKFLVTIFMCVITIALAVLCVLPKLSRASGKPVITVHSVDMTYEQGDDTGKLLTNVSAYDKEDGDISDDIRVYDFAVLLDGENAAVTYGVYDSDNNLATAMRIVAYKGEEPEVETTTDAQESPDGSGDDANSDDLQGNGLTGEGYDDPELVSTGKPVIRLLTHEITLSVGDEFYSMDYVDTAVDDKDSLSYLYRHMYLEGDELDTGTAGDYELIYYCVDSEDNKSNPAKLMVRVIDEAASEEQETNE